MSKIKVTIDNSDSDFKPITVLMSITFESPKEIEDFQEEFISGDFQRFSTSYSTVLSNVLDKLKYTVNKL